MADPFSGPPMEGWMESNSMNWLASSSRSDQFSATDSSSSANLLQPSVTRKEVHSIGNSTFMEDCNRKLNAALEAVFIAPSPKVVMVPLQNRSPSVIQGTNNSIRGNGSSLFMGDSIAGDDGLLVSNASCMKKLVLDEEVPHVQGQPLDQEDEFENLDGVGL